MKLLLNIFLLLSFSLLFSELHAQCSVTTNVISNYNGQDISCSGATDGIATAVATGGTAPYTFLWDDLAATTNDTVFNLNAGIYRVTITDNIGCTTIDSVILTEPTFLVSTIVAVTDVSCTGTCTGSATVLATGGAGAPYAYIWDAAAGNQTSSTATGLCSGSYTVDIIDINGCVTTDFVVITEPTIPLAFTFSNVTNPSSPGAADGTATILATGGSAPYTYLWPTGATTATETTLSAGIYCVTIVDMAGCQATNCITLTDRQITLRGEVRLDSNNNCLPDSTESLIGSQIIKTTNTNTGTILYFSTNQNGLYEADLDTGSYLLEYFPINTLYSSTCINTQNITISTLNTTDTVNWVIETGTPCHLMTVSIGAPFLRRAGGGSYYNVYYCNQGTLDAYNSYVEVDIDPFLTVLNTSVPIASQVGNTYQFNLDTVRVGECGNILIYVVVDSTAILGQTHCSQAHIYPDSSCLPLWNGPVLEATNACLNDSIFFKIRNIGTNMLAAEDYSIFEDDIIIDMDPFNLNGGDSIEISLPIDSGRTYRIQTRQANGFPPQLGALIVHSEREGCLPFSNGSFNTGFLTQYYTGNTALFVDNDCQPNIASFDPNDKAAQPKGYGTPHYIEANTPLKYRVRFQNTGTDTAFNVVIVDTLSSHLDASSLLMGASSHPYTWALNGAGVLTVSFDNIMLVDSNTNEPLSHGFFYYDIEQVPNLMNGTVINNQAGIYFDFNLPIFTNTTFHTIGENYIPIVLNMQEAWIEEMQVHIYPNPTSGLIHIEQLNGKDIQINVFDNLGRKVLQRNANDKQTTLDLNSLSNGIYYINIQQEQKTSTHKVIKH